MKTFLFFLISTLSVNAFGYELVLIQGISKSKQTFVTRKGKKDGLFTGKKVTFTSNNVSVIARALKVSREFTQWEIINDFTDVPFNKGEIVTMYDTTEYLWALNPEKVKSKYIKSKVYKPRFALEVATAFSRGLSESVTGADASNTERGGVQFEGMLQREFSRTYSMAVGLRYTKEVINIEAASYTNQRFLGIIEGRYYFDPLTDFYNSKISLGLGFGLGQSYTETNGLASSGSSGILPAFKIGLNIPINKDSDFQTYGAIESVQIQETLQDSTLQKTNLVNSKVGFVYRKYL